MAPSNQQAAPRSNALYFTAWRWHFYAGLFVIPFVMTLAITGMIMLLTTSQSNQMGYVADIAVGESTLPISTQAQAALATVPDGVLNQYIAPEGVDRPTFFAIRDADAVISVAVNPYTGEVLNQIDKTKTLYAYANKIHGTLMIGDAGDRLIEAAVSLMLLLIATGLYMWLPKMGWRALVPDLSGRGRSFWKSLHATTGTWIAVFLVLFALSGLAWAGIWGGKFVQPWSSFPAEKNSSMWSSDVTHASLNHGPLDEVPWGLELTPMPVSGTDAGIAGVPSPVALDSVVQWAAANGFVRQYKVSLPASETGVYTVMAEGRNEDSVNPSSDRTVHIDQYTGNVLADIGYAEYSLVAKAMAWGIALHRGLAGTWNFVLNIVLISAILFTCISGAVVWWKRRPAGAGRLAAPPRPEALPHWKGALLVALAIALAFPMAGISLIVVLLVDLLVIERLPALRQALS